MSEALLRIALLHGMRHEPADGIWNNSGRLAEALQRKGHDVTRVEVAWNTRGWKRALGDLRRDLSGGCDWVVLPYTPLLWSRRGFPWRVYLVTRAVRRSGAGLVVHIHDPLVSTGPRLIDRVRAAFQTFVVRRLSRSALRLFVSIQPGSIPWMDGSLRARTVVVVTGSAIPTDAGRHSGWVKDRLRVVVFGVSPRREAQEMGDVATVLRTLKEGGVAVHLTLIGGGADRGAALLRDDPGVRGIEIEDRGIASEHAIDEVLAASDVLLFVRTGVSSRRSTVIAGIAHGLPILGYETAETGPPVTEAGVVLVPEGSAKDLADATLGLARDPAWAAALGARSVAAAEGAFSWDRIAGVVLRGLEEADR
ncbi:MAG: hypothetical protein WD004_00600 [Actinomycetota bacterium]